MVEGDTQETAAVIRIAAAQLFRSLFQHQNTIGAGESRRDAGRQCGIARARDNYVKIRHATSQLLPLKAGITYFANRSSERTT